MMSCSNELSGLRGFSLMNWAQAHCIALGDVDRWPWLKLLAQRSVAWEAQGGAVLDCSAIKQVDRDTLLAHVPNHHIVHLELSRVGAGIVHMARR